jgi:hypothetical protein
MKDVCLIAAFNLFIKLVEELRFAQRIKIITSIAKKYEGGFKNIVQEEHPLPENLH